MSMEGLFLMDARLGNHLIVSNPDDGPKDQAWLQHFLESDAENTSNLQRVTFDPATVATEHEEPGRRVLIWQDLDAFSRSFEVKIEYGHEVAAHDQRVAATIEALRAGGLSEWRPGIWRRTEKADA